MKLLLAKQSIVLVVAAQESAHVKVLKQTQLLRTPFSVKFVTAAVAVTAVRTAPASSAKLLDNDRVVLPYLSN